MKMKLLSPAGDFESLKMAVYYGADEVYLGVKDFNARNIEGFNLETLKQAVEFAHLFDVKIHLAVNILFSNEELQSALDLIVDASNIGVDAFIIQDLGLANLVHKHFPNIVIHASTQMGIHNLEGALFAKQIGFSRIVLSRETPLSEIKRIKENCDIEIEYFAQGALCVSFSGNCYLSSYLCNASGNRGKCKQLCRLPYTLKCKNEKIAEGFLLSAKDFNMLNHLDDLENAGVCSIKIEGRARRPFYVATATDIYRKALDKKQYNEENLKLAFNRFYTAGYFDGNGNIISNFPAHIGIEVGKVTKIENGKNFNKVFFSSEKILTPKSTFKIFRNEVEVSTLTAFDLKQISKNSYYLTTTQKLKEGDKINLILDYEQENNILSFSKKVKTDLSIFAFPNKPISATAKVKNKTFEISGDVCQEAKTNPLSENEICENFLKSELFDCVCQIKTENAFLPKKQLNEFRRKVFETIYENLSKNSNKTLKKVKIDVNFQPKPLNNFEFTKTPTGNFNKENIIFSPEIYTLTAVETFIKNCKNQNKKPFLDLPNFALFEDIKLLKNIIQTTKIGVIANNYYALNFGTETVAGGGLNVFNNISASVLNISTITAESTFNKVKFPYMTLRHCPFKQNMNANCNKCPYNENYKFVMQNGKELSISRKKLSSCTFYLTD